VSFSRRNPDDPVPKPWNWWLLGPSIVFGAIAFGLTFVLPGALMDTTSGEVPVAGLVMSLAFLVCLAACLVLGYAAVHARIHDDENPR
jgi:uncharacterized membrane protein YhaH (DUF805 family)